MKIWNKLIDTVYPPVCYSCERLFNFEDAQRNICDECKTALAPPIYENACKKCGRKTEFTYCRLCGHIKDNKVKGIDGFYFKKNYYIFIYEGIGRNLIHSFKYGENLNLINLFDELFKDWYNNEFENIDLIIPVPMYYKKEKDRGFNQSKLMAKIVSNNTNIEYDNKILFRNRATKVQSKLSLEKRYKNLEKAFEVVGNLSGKNILLVDDIYTSGSTIVNCSKALKEKGANEILSFTFALTEDKRTTIEEFLEEI